MFTALLSQGEYSETGMSNRTKTGWDCKSAFLFLVSRIVVLVTEPLAGIVTLSEGVSVGGPLQAPRLRCWADWGRRRTEVAGVQHFYVTQEPVCSKLNSSARNPKLWKPKLWNLEICLIFAYTRLVSSLFGRPFRDVVGAFRSKRASRLAGRSRGSFIGSVVARNSHHSVGCRSG